MAGLAVLGTRALHHFWVVAATIFWNTRDSAILGRGHPPYLKHRALRRCVVGPQAAEAPSPSRWRLSRSLRSGGPHLASAGWLLGPGLISEHWPSAALGKAPLFLWEHGAFAALSYKPAALGISEPLAGRGPPILGRTAGSDALGQVPPPLWPSKRRRPQCAKRRWAHLPQSSASPGVLKRWCTPAPRRRRP